MNRIGSAEALVERALFAVSLLKSLTECNTNPTHLDFDGNGNISSAIRAFVDANKAGIRLVHAESNLDLSSKGIDDAQATRVATELVDNTTVATLV
jgi:hypothetical protein